ncbi:hypothetical protein BC833DRAFT_285081 [Globomyces pollinis-pini]|nr:hypothetical protein BC833DRAFT_285081 [Globomyces pollinis-pini]
MVVRAIGNKSEKGHTRTREKSKEIPLTKNSTNETSIKSGQSSISPPKRSNTEGKTLENPVTKKFKTSPAVPDNSVRTSLSASPKRKIKDPIEHDVKRLRSSSAEELKSTEPETKASSTPVAVDMKDSSQQVIETPSFDSLSVRDWQKLARVAKTHAAELCKKGPNSNIHKGSICFAFATLCYFSELAKTGTTSGEFASRLDNIRKFKKSIDLYLLKPQVEHRKIYSLLTFCEVHFLNVAYRSINRDLNDKLRLITNIKSLQVETKSSQLANEKASYDKMLTEQSLRIGHLQESLRMAFGMSLSHSKETDLNHFSCDPFKTNFNINAFSTDCIEVDHEALELAGRQLMELALDRQVDLTFTKQDDNFFMPSI